MKTSNIKTDCVFYSKGQVFTVEELGELTETKLIFDKYEYNMPYRKINDMIIAGKFAFVNFENNVPISIELSPQFRTFIDLKNLKYAEINEFRDNEFFTSILPIKSEDQNDLLSQIELYEKKCVVHILDKI